MDPLLSDAVFGSDDALLALSAAYRDLRFERDATGKLIVMPPTGAETGKKNFNLSLAFGLWARTNELGVCFDSSAGFKLPNGAVKSADLAWVRTERWEALSPEQRSKFAPLCPDFVVELRSPSNTVDELKAKLAEFIANGTQLGWLLDPSERKAYVYEPGREPVELADPAELSGAPVLPGFVLKLSEIW